MSMINIEKISIVHWYPELEKHKCGYCRSENGSATYGMWAEQLTVEDYQTLIDRGWRRSGRYCYKPIMHDTCCPQYTIRCEASAFQPSKSQKKIIKRFNKFVREGTMLSTDSDYTAEDNDVSDIVLKEKPNMLFDMKKLNGESTCDKQEHNKQLAQSEEAAPVELQPSTSKTKKEEANVECKKLKKEYREGVGADPSKPACKKAKLLRLERKQQKLEGKGMPVDKTMGKQQQNKSLEDLLSEIPAESKHKLKIKLVLTSSPSAEWESTKSDEFALFSKYQQAIHNDSPSKCSFTRFCRFLLHSPLKIVMEKLTKTSATFKISAELFRKYQLAVHNDKPEECTEKQFVEFLVESPLKTLRVRSDGDAVTYGSFHQQYWLDEKLIAVGVLDILPNCISSVYFFYDPDYRMLNLGTYGALREVAYVKSLTQVAPSLQYYYMGYYIHSCQKMRYKGKLNRSFLLCPETYKWFSIETCIPQLEVSKYARLNEDVDGLDEDSCSPNDIDDIKVCHNYSCMLFANYKQRFNQQEVFNNIGALIGRRAAAKLLFVSSAY